MTKTLSPSLCTLCDCALDILGTADAHEKAYKTRDYKKLWDNEDIVELGFTSDTPDRPARPDKPKLLMPRDMPKRGKGNSTHNRITLLHALSHIELNAIDLAWDIIGRFSFYYQAKEGLDLPLKFYTDWLKVADDEAKHFLMLSDRLADFEACYGDLPAHDGLWSSAEKTAHDFAARLAIVPMVLEARGLDVTPHMVKLMREQEDHKTADLLQIIHDDEITHVEAGTIWFKKWCAYYDKDEEGYFQNLVRTYFHGNLKKPFNHPSREEAGMIRDWYEPLAEKEQNNE
jgi:uncharacterized ferritin-like protein (DUF455 family)